MGIKISNKARQHVREILSKYNEINAEIQEIRQSILYPHRTTDENIGGGKSSFLHFETEEKAIKLATNRQIKFRSEVIYVIDTILDKCSEEAQQIIKAKYFCKESPSWVKIAGQVAGYSEESCRKIERKIVDLIAEELGW
ncbi:RinA family phage transcriptional activator [Enterococcus sp. PF1-24]|uniref:hypothetical protein n=1 Tax=unclassified Enterococcus TaxID=2608891 RepID=UPI002475B539|nr:MULTISPECIES: hypothetical protein [unclassified Enterococcus]MDH6364654.1 RinA family phage transcriptional activator [Enterococcus sp. PFB1-1]MDH6401755.1 RinA family phage transcriptional activator [Enterococcus sp. PF1-24]